MNVCAQRRSGVRPIHRASPDSYHHNAKSQFDAVESVSLIVNYETTACSLWVFEGRAMLVDCQSQTAGNGLVLDVDLGSDPRHSQLVCLWPPVLSASSNLPD